MLSVEAKHRNHETSLIPLTVAGIMALAIGTMVVRSFSGDIWGADDTRGGRSLSYDGPFLGKPGILKISEYNPLAVESIPVSRVTQSGNHYLLVQALDARTAADATEQVKRVCDVVSEGPWIDENRVQTAMLQVADSTCIGKRPQ